MEIVNNGFVANNDKDLTLQATKNSSPQNSGISSPKSRNRLSSFSFGAPKAEKHVLTPSTYPLTQDPLGQMSHPSRSTHKARKQDPPKDSRYHYSLRLESSTSPDPAAPSRRNIPRSTQHLSLDYSFIHDHSPSSSSSHPSLHEIDIRIAKHVKYIVSRCEHHHSFHTFKLIFLTANCCAECGEDSIAKTFGFIPPAYTATNSWGRGSKLSLTQKALLKLKPKLRDGFSIVAYQDPEKCNPGKPKRMEMEGRDVEVLKGESELGVKVDKVQMRAQVDLEAVKSWPVVYNWFCWSN